MSALLAFAAHPDDLEFAVGAVLAKEVRAGRAVHTVVCSRGESGTHGTAAERAAEAWAAAGILGTNLEFLALDGDAHLEIKLAHTLALAAVIRRIKPAVVLAPTVVENQHPDHGRLGQMVRDAARLARYGGVAELGAAGAHAIAALLYYAVTPEGEPGDQMPVLIDVSDAGLMETWKAAMAAHASQMRTRNYVELQLARARLNGLRAGVGHAVALFTGEPLVLESLSAVLRTARSF